MDKIQLLCILQSCILYYEGYSHADLISIGLDKRDALGNLLYVITITIRGAENPHISINTIKPHTSESKYGNTSLNTLLYSTLIFKMVKKIQEVHELKCNICGKLIIAINEGQADYNMKQHKLSHEVTNGSTNNS